jgi:hypothetical protein
LNDPLLEKMETASDHKPTTLQDNYIAFTNRLRVLRHVIDLPSALVIFWPTD